MSDKFGVVAVGEIDGELMIIAPYTEGRILDGEVSFQTSKGSPDLKLRV